MSNPGNADPSLTPGRDGTPPFTPSYEAAVGNVTLESVTGRRRRWRRLASLLPELLLPNPCLGCGAPLRDGGSPADFGLCLACRGRLARHVPGCPRCGAPLPGRRRRAEPCKPCRRRPPPFALLLSPWLFTSPLVSVIHALKFGRCPHLGAALARPLAARLREGWPLLFGEPTPAQVEAPVVAPVPLHPWRRLRRGYDQAAEIAGPLAEFLGLEALAPLQRRRATRPQVGLPRQQRLENVTGAFTVPRHQRRSVARCTVLLVDDVATTGATLASAAAALRRAGARRVVALAVARTPPPAASPPVAPATPRRLGHGRTDRRGSS